MRARTARRLPATRIARWVVLAGVAAAPLAAGPGVAAESPRWAAPVLVTSGWHRETNLAIDPTDDRRRLACSPAGLPALRGQSHFFLSRDAGRTWRRTDVEGAPTDTRRASFEGGDCDVAFDAAGTMYVADVSGVDVSIGHSKDHGRTWEGSAAVGVGPTGDRPWLVGGPRGTVLMTYQDLMCCAPTTIWFLRSTDYGRTFSPRVPVTTADAAGVLSWQGNLVVSPDGRRLALPFTRRTSFGIGVNDDEPPPLGPATLWIAQSDDGGATWTERQLVALSQEPTTIFPVVGRDAGGGLHVVWSGAAAVGNPVWYIGSHDGGRTWREPIALNPGRVGLAPWVVGGRRGEAVVAWLGSPDPRASPDVVADYFFSWARVTTARGRTVVRTGSTTQEPVFTGAQRLPEFQAVRLDRQGRMQLGMSVSAGRGEWVFYAQSER